MIETAKKQWKELIHKLHTMKYETTQGGKKLRNQG